MEKTKLIKTFSNSESIFEIYSVDNIFIPGGYDLNFYVIQKKKKFESRKLFREYIW
jgi:hypothetical protein